MTQLIIQILLIIFLTLSCQKSENIINSKSSLKQSQKLSVDKNEGYYYNHLDVHSFSDLEKRALSWDKFIRNRKAVKLEKVNFVRLYLANMYEEMRKDEFSDRSKELFIYELFTVLEKIQSKFTQKKALNPGLTNGKREASHAKSLYNLILIELIQNKYESITKTLISSLFTEVTGIMTDHFIPDVLHSRPNSIVRFFMQGLVNHYVKRGFLVFINDNRLTNHSLILEKAKRIFNGSHHKKVYNKFNTSKVDTQKLVIKNLNTALNIKDIYLEAGHSIQLHSKIKLLLKEINYNDSLLEKNSLYRKLQFTADRLLE